MLAIGDYTSGTLGSVNVVAGGQRRRAPAVVISVLSRAYERPFCQRAARTRQPRFCLAYFNEGDNLEQTVSFRPGESLLGSARTGTGDWLDDFQQ
jgi:hypothetical protein